MKKKAFFELAARYDYHDSSYFWGESGQSISFAFDICLALWAYWLGNNGADSVIQAILQKMEFRPGMGLTELDIIEDETGEYREASMIYEECVEGDFQTYIDALEYIHENLERVK